MPPTQRDLDALAHDPNFNVKVQIERRETEPDAEHRRRKDYVAFWAVIVALAVLMGVAVLVVLIPGLAPESRSWATSVLSAIVAGSLGYLGGKKHAD